MDFAREARVEEQSKALSALSVGRGREELPAAPDSPGDESETVAPRHIGLPVSADLDRLSHAALQSAYPADGALHIGSTLSASTLDESVAAAYAADEKHIGAPLAVDSPMTDYGADDSSYLGTRLAADDEEQISLMFPGFREKHIGKPLSAQ
jgi:hypothetical protein